MKPVSHTGLIRSLSRLTRDVRAVSAIEFALILPIMVTLFLGGTELSQAIAVKRKSVLVNRTIADLVAQDSSITNTEMSGIFSASAAVVQPYNAGNLRLIVSGVIIDAVGAATVAWSDGYQATARTVGSGLTLPPGLNIPNTWLVFSETTYNYTPPIGYTIVGTLPLKDTMYLRPRLTSTISRVP